MSDSNPPVPPPEDQLESEDLFNTAVVSTQHVIVQRVEVPEHGATEITKIATTQSRLKIKEADAEVDRIQRGLDAEQRRKDDEKDRDLARKQQLIGTIVNHFKELIPFAIIFLIVTTGTYLVVFHTTNDRVFMAGLGLLANAFSAAAGYAFGSRRTKKKK